MDFQKVFHDLASMVAKSQLLGDTLSVAQGFADQIMDSPEKAYEYAAQLQTLGGSFSQLRRWCTVIVHGPKRLERVK
jgi:hypothetical protein